MALVSFLVLCLFFRVHCESVSHFDQLFFLCTSSFCLISLIRRFASNLWPWSRLFCRIFLAIEHFNIVSNRVKTDNWGALANVGCYRLTDCISNIQYLTFWTVWSEGGWYDTKLPPSYSLFNDKNDRLFRTVCL